MAAAGAVADPGRIIDLTLAGARYEIMKAAIDTMMAAPEFGIVVVIVGSTARFQPQQVVRSVIESVNGPKPLVAFVAPEAPEAMVRLAEGGVPCFRTPEACADAIAGALARRPPKPMVVRTAVPARGGAGRTLDEAEAYQLLGQLGIAHAPTAVLPVDMAAAPQLSLPYPVALKVLSADIAHKTDAGGVALNIADGAALVRAVADMRKAIAAKRPDAAFERVLVQPMVTGVGEALIGYRIDPDAGPVVLLAAGGVMTEIYQDRALRLAPVDLADAHAMIREVKALKALAGFRGKPPGDLDALAHAIVALSQLATREETVLEAEINPLIVRPAGQGVVAVDALVRLAR
jgi:acetate---CoA ligase (ADP-forming)